MSETFRVAMTLELPSPCMPHQPFTAHLMVRRRRRCGEVVVEAKGMAQVVSVIVWLKVVSSNVVGALTSNVGRPIP